MYTISQERHNRNGMKSGGCRLGKVAYESKCSSLDNEVHHCKKGQHQDGRNFGIWVIIEIFNCKDGNTEYIGERPIRNWKYTVLNYSIY